MKQKSAYQQFPRILGRKRLLVAVCATMLAIFSGLSSIEIFAQTTSGIFGVVTDATGAIVVGANITATNVATGVEHNATTNSDGSYRIPQLPPGSYTMDVANTGFQTQHLQAFTLLVGQQSQLNITLAIGQATQTISVSAASLLIDTQTSNQDQVIGNQQIETLPLNGRDYMQLAQLSAGVTPITPGMSSPANQWTGTSTVAVSIAGLREDDTSYLYDGIETRNAWYGAEGLLPSIDNIQEFNVIQSGAPAQYAAGGAFISVVTRSGTNEIHGSVYEFLRNNDLDARNYFDVGSAPPFHQNQFGARLGGPIKKNKMFFFLNYEGFRLLQPTTQYALVPTAEQLAGNFSADTKQLFNPFTGAPFAGNQIGAASFNSVGQKILSYYPLPNGLYSGGTNYRYLSNTTNGWDQESGRFDYAISAKDSIFARFTNQSQTTNVTDITPSREIVYPSNPKNLSFGWTHTFSPNLVNNVRFGYTHTATGEQRADGFNPAAANPLGLINAQGQAGSYGPPSFGVTNYANPGSTEGTDIVREGLTMGTESITIQKGKHQISAGFDIRYEPIYMYEDWAATSISFNGNYSGDPVADILLGVPTSGFAALGDPLLNLRMWYQSYFVQDNVKLNKRLSVNVGLNYEHRRQPVDTQNHVGSFDVATNSDLSYPDTKVLGLDRAMVKPRFLNFAPRIGFNFVPFDDGNTDVKGGFGIYFIQPNINQYEVMVDTTKYYLIQSYNNSTTAPPAGYIPTPSNPGPPLFTVGDLFGPTVPGGGPTASFIQPDAKTPYTYEWNLTIDRTIKNWLAEVGYLGSAAHHYEERPNIAPLLNSAGDTSLPGWNGVQENTSSGSSFYSALFLRAEHRYSSGFSVLGNYTFSKCLGYPWQDVFSWHPLNLRLDRGHCQEDLNQNLVANAIYELPFGKGKAYLNQGGIVNALAGGWKAAVIASLHSGYWSTLGSNQNLGIFVNALPDVTGPVNNSSLHSGLGKNGRLGPYFNTGNVVPVTAEAVQGNASVQSLQNPGYADWDISAYKGWTFADRYTVDFRGDFFNAFNRANFYGLDAGVNDARFGLVTNANAAREIQLSLRFTF
ncbi:carboxypeptidase regulatory-like domain-containing protein [Acidisarcina polymorpha]|nr:carboxypeptidase regulatory-like domain-containing protein [Acidisarcina polymorpha]